MSDPENLTPGQKLLLTCQLHDLGVAIMRQNLRRRQPDAAENEIDHMLTDWLQTRPGAEHGDCAGPDFRVRPL